LITSVTYLFFLTSGFVAHGVIGGALCEWLDKAFFLVVFAMSSLPGVLGVLGASLSVLLLTAVPAIVAATLASAVILTPKRPISW